MDRLLFQTVEEGNFNGGIIFGLIIGKNNETNSNLVGVLYMCAFIYFIYKKFLSIIIEDLICLLDGKENDDTYRPVVYSVLNSLLFLILCFFCTFSSQSDFGIATIIGSDAFNIFFILSVIFIKFNDSNHGILDTWLTFRDTLIYIIGLVSLMLIILFDWVNLWSALIMIVYYVINYGVLSNNQDIKEKVMDWFGLNNEDNEFNSDEHFQCKKRRVSSSNLKETGCFDNTDQNLQRKLNRMEALLVLRFGSPEHPQKLIYGRFQKVVYQIIFGIRNQARLEKLKRTEFYQSLYKPRQSKDQKKQNDSSSQDDKKSNNDLQQLEEDDHPLIKKKDDGVQSQKDSKDNDQEIPQKQLNVDNNNANDDESSYAEHGGVSLKMPKSIGEKILFVIFFPIMLILYFLPNYVENPIPKKLVLCLFLNILLLCGCCFLIDWWTWEISRGTGIPFQILGMVFTGIFMSIHFLEYNLKVAKEENQLEFVQSFLQIGICKMSLCPAIPWVFKVIVALDVDIFTRVTYYQSFALTVGIFGGMILLFLLLAIFCRFKLRSQEGIKMGVMYALFILVSILVIALDVLEL